MVFLIVSVALNLALAAMFLCLFRHHRQVEEDLVSAKYERDAFRDRLKIAEDQYKRANERRRALQEEVSVMQAFVNGVRDQLALLEVADEAAHAVDSALARNSPSPQPLAPSL